MMDRKTFLIATLLACWTSPDVALAQGSGNGNGNGNVGNFNGNGNSGNFNGNGNSTDFNGNGNFGSEAGNGNSIGGGLTNRRYGTWPFGTRHLWTDWFSRRH